MKTFKFDQLSRKAKKVAIYEAREYLKGQFRHYKTVEWEPTKQNCISEAHDFTYNEAGHTYDVIGGQA